MVPNSTPTPKAGPTHFGSLPFELRQRVVALAFPTLSERHTGMRVSRDFYRLVGTLRPFSDMASGGHGARDADNVRALSRYMNGLPRPVRVSLQRAWRGQASHPREQLAEAHGLLARHAAEWVGHNATAWLALPRASRREPHLARLALAGGDPSPYRLLPSPLRAQPELACLALARSPAALQHLPPALVDHRDVRLACVPHVLNARITEPSFSPGLSAAEHPTLRATRLCLQQDLEFSCDAARQHPAVLSQLLPLVAWPSALCIAHLQEPGRLLPLRQDQRPYPSHLLEQALCSHPGNLFRFAPSSGWDAARLTAAIDSGVPLPWREPALVQHFCAKPALAAAVVVRQPDLFFELPAALYHDVGVGRAMLQGGGRLPIDALSWSAFVDDVGLARQVARRTPAMLEMFSDACLRDREVVKEQIRHAACFPSPSLRALYRDDAELLLLAAERGPSEVQFASDRLLADPHFLLRALRRSPYIGWLDRADAKWLDDAKFMHAVIAIHWRGFSYASRRLRADQAFCARAIAQNGCVLSWPMPAQLLADPALVGLGLHSASEVLRLSDLPSPVALDERGSIAAVQNSAYNYLQLTDAMQRSRNVVTAALRQSGACYCWLPKELRDDASLLLLAVSHTNQNLLPAASKRLGNEQEVLAACFARSAATLTHAVWRQGTASSWPLFEHFLRLYPQALWHLTDRQLEHPWYRRAAALAFSQSATRTTEAVTPDTVPAGLVAVAREHLFRNWPGPSLPEGAER